MAHYSRLKVAVLPLDEAQSYRDTETTTIETIRRYAEEFGAEFTRLSLAGSQFRCSGSIEYLTWLDALLDVSVGRSGSSPTAAWRTATRASFGFEMFDDPQQLEDWLRGKIRSGATARFTASYAREWVSKAVVRSYQLSAVAKDFCIR